MKKILVNVNEENLEKIRDEWAGIRGYRSSNSDIVNELMMSELFKLQQLHCSWNMVSGRKVRMFIKSRKVGC